MYYDDEARRFNFASGLILGAVLGTGLALLGLPHRRSRPPRRIRGAAEEARRAVGSRLDDLAEPLARIRDAAGRAAR